jgi:hypothetical protein
MRTTNEGTSSDAAEGGAECEERTFTIDRVARSKTHGGYLYYPSLRLVGRWLERAGFGYGERVTVIVESGRLIITTHGKDSGGSAEVTASGEGGHSAVRP